MAMSRYRWPLWLLLGALLVLGVAGCGEQGRTVEEPSVEASFTGVIPVQTFPAWGYLIVADEIVAVDVGAPSVAEKMVEIVERQLGRNADAIKWVVATHYHVDHIGGISRLLELAQARVMLHKNAKGFVEDTDDLVFPPLYRWPNMLINRIEVPEPSASRGDYTGMEKIGVPYFNKPASFNVASYYEDGDVLPGGGGFRVVETPGHTACSVCFYNERTHELISGDTVMGGKHGPDPNTYVVSRERLAQSIRKLKKRRVDVLYPGHGLILKGESLLDNVSEMPVPDGIRGLATRLRQQK